MGNSLRMPGVDSAMRTKSKLLVDSVIDGSVNLFELFDSRGDMSDEDKIVCSDAIRQISRIAPDLLQPFVHELAECINCRIPSVKLGVQRAVGNLAKSFPKCVSPTIPGIVNNTKDPGTAVRWCAAYGLTEIAKNNPDTREDLVPLFKSLVEDEKSPEVRAVYLRTLHKIDN